jgi:outer membrane protein
MANRLSTCRNSLQFVVCLLSAAVLLCAQRPVVRIGVVFDGPSEGNSVSLENYTREITELLQEEFDVRFPAGKTLTADWTADGVKSVVSQLLEDAEVEQVLALGLISTNDLGRRGPLPKPCFGAIVADPEIQGFPIATIEQKVSEDATESVRVSGVENLNYITMGIDIEREFNTFRRVSPHDRVGVLYSKALIAIVPDFEQRLGANIGKFGYDKVDAIPAGESADELLASLPEDVDAIYFSAMPQFTKAELERLIQGLIDRKLPSFSQTGRPEVEMGMLATLTRTQTYVRRARRIALNMQQVLAGEPAAEQPVEFVRRETLAINMDTARAIGVSPTFLIMTEAELINEERTDVQRTTSLAEVVREAENVNLDLAVADQRVAIGKQLVRQARSPLLPQVGISGGGTFIDKDRANLGAGQNPQRLAFGDLSFSQLLYSNDAHTAFQVETNNQRAREEDRNGVRLDVIGEVSSSYLDVLRAKTVERIQQDNLELTRTNLELARVRVEIGQAGREEVYRWESQLANNRRDVIDTNAARNQTEIQLNRVLNRPVEESFITVEAGLDDPDMVVSFEQLRPYVQSPAAFDVFREFMNGEAEAQSPELRQVENLLRSAQRSLVGSKRSYYIPDVSAGASGTYLGRYGAGSTRPDPPLDSFFTNPWNWQLSVTGSYTIFNGGFREARLSGDQEAVRQFELDLQATKQRVDQQVRSALHSAGASFAGIDLAQDAAEAARRNLDLVSESYAEGVVDILRLIDAQNWALSADLVAANAIYNHLLDMTNVQRAVGRFDYFRSAVDRQEFLTRLDEFFRNAGYEVRK